MPQDGRRWRLWAALLAAVVAVSAGVWAFSTNGPGAPPVQSEAGSTPTSDPSAGPSSDAPDEPSESATARTPTPTPVLPPVDPDAPQGPVPETTLPPVPLDEEAAFGTGVSARLTAVESVDGEARGPGEVAGPAVRVTVELENGTDAAITLDKVIVDLFTGDDLAPGEPLSGPGVRWFEGDLEPDGEATGIYVFAVPADRRDLVHVKVSYDPVQPTVLFEGPGTPA